MTISCPKLSHQPRNGKPLSCPPYKCLVNLTANYQLHFAPSGPIYIVILDRSCMACEMTNLLQGSASRWKRAEWRAEPLNGER